MITLDRLLLALVTFFTVLIALLFLIPSKIVLQESVCISEESIQKVTPTPILQKSITMSGCDVFKISNNRSIRLGTLIEKSLSCKILKSLSAEGENYCLIQITEQGYKPDKWIIRNKDVLWIDTKSFIF